MRKLPIPFLILAILLSGCAVSPSGLGHLARSIAADTADSTSDSGGSADSASLSQEPGGSSLTVLDLKKKYGGAQPSTLMPLYNVEHDQAFKIRFNCDLYDLFFYDDVVTVHTDPRALPESRINTRNSLEDDDAKKSVLIVEPRFAALTSPDTGRDEQTSWGYAPIYYLRINYDLNAAERTKLEQPIIVPFTIKSELQAPNAHYEIDSDGRFKLVWNPVEGADKYNVYQVYSDYKNTESISGPEQGYEMAMPRLVGTVKGTEFQDFNSDGNNGLLYEEEYEQQQIVTVQNYVVNGQYYVSAVNGKGESNFGSPVSTMELSKSLPYSLENREIYFTAYPSVKDLPRTVKVKTLDESTVNRTILYDPDHLDLRTGYAYVPFTVEGTALTGNALVLSSDEKAFKKLAPEDGQNQRSRREGLIQAESATNHAPDPGVPTLIRYDRKRLDERYLVNAQLRNTERYVEEGDREAVPQPDIAREVKINADSALEEYLAWHLIAADGEISLKAFPEAQYFDALLDTLRKVIHQNPIILDVAKYGYDYNSLTLYIDYNDTSGHIKRKQQEILKEAARLAPTLIRDGMGDEEKQRAIYDYLNDNAQYDDDAADNAERNQFKKVDGRYADSFETYGVLVKKIGVCSSYASAFKLLADLAGLDSIVVTGRLDNVPHAWNKVKIDGEWRNVDPTNNETNTGIPYMLYDSNDETAQELQFVADNEYWTDHELGQFKSGDNSRDYYVSRGLEMDSLDRFADTLAESLRQGNDRLIVRFDGPIDEDAAVDEIVDVYDRVAPERMEDILYEIVDDYLIVSH